MSEYLLTGGRLWTGARAAVLDRGAVLVRDRQIVAAGDVAETIAQASSAAEQIELPADTTILPGLINGFVRLALNGVQNPYAEIERDQQDGSLPGRMAERASRTLSAGVTTVRDVGAPGTTALDLAAGVERGDLPGPRVLASGAALTTPDGDALLIGEPVTDPAAIRDAVERRRHGGAAFVEFHDSGSHLPGEPEFWETQFSPEQCRQIVAVARDNGLKVASHTHSAGGIVQAADAGVNIIDQFTWSVGYEEFRRDDAVARRIADHGIAVCIPSNSNRLRVIEKYGEQAAIDNWYYRYSWLEELGIPLLPGSSAGTTNSPFDDYVNGLDTYEYMGFSLPRILELATSSAAAILGIADTTGQLRPGMDADILAVAGDPFTDLQALRNVQLVFARGKLGHVAPPQTLNP